MMNAAGLYIHIPFCKSKCPYCDFYSVKYDSASAEAYTQRLCREIKKYTGSFDTVYIGGGTPSVLPYQLIGRILDTVKEQFDISPDAEITIECNPSKNLEEDFKQYKRFGINRISLGMQSARNEERFALGRSADRADVAKAVNDARRAGIYNISLDVMLGTPKQSLESLDETFDFIYNMNVPHISAYMLKIEEGTKFFDMKERLALPDDDTVAQMYLKTVSELSAMELAQYEISNFAKPGFESRHNTKYWTLEEYLGIGASAHSFYKGKRFYYDRNFNIVPDGDGGGPEERIMLGLRLKKGIDKSLVTKDYSQFVRMGLISENGNRISLTADGMLVSNTIINSLI